MKKNELLINKEVSNLVNKLSSISELLNFDTSNYNEMYHEVDIECNINQYSFYLSGIDVDTNPSLSPGTETMEAKRFIELIFNGYNIKLSSQDKEELIILINKINTLILKDFE